MRFKVIGRSVFPPDSVPGVLYLMRDNWNDYSYMTLFEAYYCGEFVGGVKIAFRGMTKQTPTIDRIPHEFESLPDDYYSLWPGIKACQNAYDVCEKSGSNIFSALNDVSYDLSRFDEVIDEDACRTSLMREASALAIRGQLHRITHGKAALTKYSFRFTLGPDGGGGEERIAFTVTPEELPPSNVHVVIGRNGVGKTHLLNDLALAACRSDDAPAERPLAFDFDQGVLSDEWKCSDFANVLVVSFSPFDSYNGVAALAERDNYVAPISNDGRIPCRFVGLNGKSGDLEGSIESAFENGVKGCCAGRTRFNRWVNSLATLRSDPMFDDTLSDAWAMIDRLGLERVSEGEMHSFRTELYTAFDKLSSGHKAVLSIVTGCVAMLEERSLVLLDEPENHLHPPLLAAFMRAFSELLVDRNSVAVIATHSPVVLQEVPRSCVWMLDRNGEAWFSRRPDCETFGANFERLTSQVFGVEVEKSGFHKMLREAVRKSATFEDALALFTCGLGDEALGILRLLWIAKEKGRLR